MAKIRHFPGSSNSRGYLFTILSYLIMVSIFSLAIYFSNICFEQKEAASLLNGFSKTRMLAANTESSLKAIYDVFPYSSNSSITIRDHMTADYDISGLLDSYLLYLDYFGNETASNISFSSAGTVFSIEPGNFTYEYDSFLKNTISLYSPSSSPSAYSVVLTVPDSYEVGTTDSHTVLGSFPLYVKFEKGSGPIWTAADDLIDLTSCSWYYMDFDAGASSLNVSSGACLGYSNALIIRGAGGQKADILLIMNSSSPSMIYPSDLTVLDLVSGFSISRYPVLSAP